MSESNIKPITIEHVNRYGEIYAIVGLNLITEAEGFLPEFYERYGFSRENRVILMGKEL